MPLRFSTGCGKQYTHMCKTKTAVNASDPERAAHSSRAPPRPPTLPTAAAAAASSSSSNAAASDPSTSSNRITASNTTSSTVSSRASLSSLRGSLSQNPHIYSFSEIRAATNNFLAKRYSSSSSSSSSSAVSACWRCTLRNSDTIVFQRKFRRKIEMSELKELLPVICRSHHRSVIQLLGASISGDHIYLVYKFINGANLADCLRNSKNPNFTVLSNWMSRMQIAADLADALDYIHNKTGLNLRLVHNRIKSSSIIVTEASLNAMISHFGTAQLCGEATEENPLSSPPPSEQPKQLMRSDSRAMQFEGVRGYMSPEFQATGIATQKSDVFAFGVVILELLSGEEPLKYKFDKRRGNFVRNAVIETAEAAVGGEGDGGGTGWRLRKWVDKKLRDSFPLQVVEKLTRLALECVHVDADKRPDMGRVAGKISRLYIESKNWSDNNTGIPDQISVSLAPR